MPDPLFTKRASPTFNEPTTTAINILIVGNVARFSRYEYETRETPTRFTFDAHRIARSRAECVRVRTARARARERAGSAFCFGGFGSARGLPVERQVYGLFQAVCYGRRGIFKASSRDRDTVALNFRYAHARARNRKTSRGTVASISGSCFRHVVKLPKFRFRLDPD